MKTVLDSTLATMDHHFFDLQKAELLYHCIVFKSVCLDCL